MEPSSQDAQSDSSYDDLPSAILQPEEQQVHENRLLPPEISAANNSTLQHSMFQDKISKEVLQRYSQGIMNYSEELLKIPRRNYLPPITDYLSRDYLDQTKIYTLENTSAIMSLCFLPQHILILPPGSHNPRQRLRDLYDELINGCTTGEVDKRYLDKQKLVHERRLIFRPRVQVQYKMFHYDIKVLGCSNDKCRHYSQKNSVTPECVNYDSDLLVDKLFSFYLHICPRLKHLAVFMIDWAYKRQILTPQYLPQSALKLLILAALHRLRNITNVIQLYREQYDQECKAIKKCLIIGKKGLPQIDSIIKNYTSKYVIEYKAGFRNSEGDRVKYPFIHTIDFPILPNQVKKLKEKLSQEASNAFDKWEYGKWVVTFFMEFAKVFNMNGGKVGIRVDLALLKGTEQFRTEDKCEEAYLDVVHPVYGYNITEHLKGQAFNVVRDEFIRGFDILKDGNLQKMGNLCAEYKK